MTPEEKERLKACAAEIAEIWYKNTEVNELSNLETIEKHIREQWLELVGPEVGFFYQTGNRNTTGTNPHSKKLHWAANTNRKTSTEIAS